MNKFDLSGKRFGRLIVIKKSKDHIRKNGIHQSQWLCKCDCGNEVVVMMQNLVSGNTSSCGCLKKEKHCKHNFSKKRIYSVYNSMLARCYNKKKNKYKDYGGRGIIVCDEWLNNPVSFFNWAEKTGYNEKSKYGECTLDRIDVNGNYCPENCRWVDMKTQCRNRRNNKILTYKGETKTLSEWCDILNLRYHTIFKRIYILKMSVEKAFEKV